MSPLQHHLVEPRSAAAIKHSCAGASMSVDGARGEGGGQVLRTSVALSLIGQRELVVHNIRAKRSRPGLLRQHLTAIQAAARISNARLEGDELGAASLRLVPQPVVPGDYRFSVGSAGSATLVLQTILLPLLLAPGRSRVRVEGGTHNPKAPTYHYLERVFFDALRKMGATIESRLDRIGFFPAGGGAIEVEIEGGHALRPLRLLERGARVGQHAMVLTAHLPEHIAQREIKVLRKRLGWSEVEIVQVPSSGPGNVVQIELRFEQLNELFTAFAARGLPAERVAKRVLKDLRDYLEHPFAVGEFLADQLMLPMALVGGAFETRALSLHASTNLALLEEFLPLEVDQEPLDRAGVEGLQLRFWPGSKRGEGPSVA